jgi:hypothetical protein
MPRAHSFLRVLACTPAFVFGCADHADDHDFDLGYVDSEIAVAGRWSVPAAVHSISQTQDVAYDGPPPWNGGASCSGALFAGTRIVGDYLKREFGGVSSYGGYACRQNTANSAQTSVHGTGRALDVFIPMVGGQADNTAGDAVANFLITHAERIGIQLVIWDQSVWQGSRSGEKLEPYGGPVPHIDHLHVELTVEASRQQTAWFNDGGPNQPPSGEPEPEWYVLSGDWDGNGTKTPGLHNVRTHRWILSNVNAGGGVAHDFGWGGDDTLPVVGDWNGDGVDTPGLYNPRSHVWTLSNVNAGGGVAAQFGWGGDGNLPMAGDWNGDGIDTPGLFAPATRTWTLSNVNAGGGVAAQFGWGGAGLIPVVGDWNGDGKDSPGLYNKATHIWTLSNVNAANGVDAQFGWGGGSRLPVVGDWNGDGRDTPGLFTGSNRVFTLSNVNAGGGEAAEFGWGPIGEFTVVGDVR